MTQKGTPLIILGVVGALIVLGIVLATVLRDGEGDSVDGDISLKVPASDSVLGEDGAQADIEGKLTIM